MTEQKIRVESTGSGQVSIGGVLSDEQKKALNSVGPTADDILNNIEQYNEEIGEISSPPQSVEPPKLPKVRVPKASSKRPNSQQLDNERFKTKREKRMDLDKELDDLDSKLDEQKSSEDSQVEETAPASDMKTQILDLLKDTADSPSEQQVLKWKAQHGHNAVHVMALGEGDVYIFTHLKRGQWKKIQEMMAKLQETNNRDVEDDLKEKVINHCCLWPSLGVEFFYNSRAGVVDSLYQVILLNSYFLSPQQAMILTTQL